MMKLCFGVYAFTTGLWLLTQSIESLGAGIEAEQENRRLNSISSDFTPIETYYVPLPEEPLFTDTFVGINKAKAKAPVNTIISIAVAAMGTRIWYDHWEDGYEGNVLSPMQSTTEVWGDYNASNGCAPSGNPCTDEHDHLKTGDAIVLENKVPVPRGSDVLFDGGDKIQASFPIAMTRAAYPVAPGALMAGAVEMLKTSAWGTTFVSPVGQGIGAEDETQAFEYTSFFIMAMRDTIVTFHYKTYPLAEGENLILPNVKPGDTLEADYPVQVDILAGDIGSNYELRWYSITPRDKWTNDYYTPVGTDDIRSTRIWIFNPNDFPITVKHERVADYGTGTSTYTVPPKTAKRSDDTGAGTGSRLFTESGDVFFAITQTDAENHDDPATGFLATGHVYDWGHPLVPANQLTSQVLVGLGYGCTDTKACAPPATGNTVTTSRLVVWVSPTSDATIYVDKNGDGTPEESVDAVALASLTFKDDSDNDMTGAIIWASDAYGNPVTIAVAWGQDPLTSGFGDPAALDLGTLVPPLPVIAAGMTYMVKDRPDGIAQPGDVVEYIIRIINLGQLDIQGGAFNIVDSPEFFDDADYIEGSCVYNIFNNDSTLMSTSPVADDSTGTTKFPLDEEGILGQGVLKMRGGAHECKFQIRVKENYSKCPAGTLVNVCEVGYTGQTNLLPIDTFQTETPVVCPRSTTTAVPISTTTLVPVSTTTTTPAPPTTGANPGICPPSFACSPIVAGEADCEIGTICSGVVGENLEVCISIFGNCCLTETHICNVPSQTFTVDPCQSTFKYDLSLEDVYDFVCAVDADVYVVAGHVTVECDGAYVCVSPTTRRLQGVQPTFHAYYELNIGCDASGAVLLP